MFIAHASIVCSFPFLSTDGMAKINPWFAVFEHWAFMSSLAWLDKTEPMYSLFPALASQKSIWIVLSFMSKSHAQPFNSAHDADSKVPNGSWSVGAAGSG